MTDFLSDKVDMTPIATFTDSNKYVHPLIVNICLVHCMVEIKYVAVDRRDVCLVSLSTQDWWCLTYAALLKIGHVVDGTGGWEGVWSGHGYWKAEGDWLCLHIHTYLAYVSL